MATGLIPLNICPRAASAPGHLAPVGKKKAGRENQYGYRLNAFEYMPPRYLGAGPSIMPPAQDFYIF